MAFADPQTTLTAQNAGASVAQGVVHASAWDEFIAPIRPLLPAGPLRREMKILLVVFCLLALWGVAIASFGIAALLVPMKLIVPAMIVGLVALTWGM